MDFLMQRAIFPPLKKIKKITRTKLREYEVFICIAYCVKQQNRITIVKENIVSRSRFAKYDSMMLFRDLLIQSCYNELWLSGFVKLACVEKSARHARLC